ncbi:hypothetical protein ACHAXS_012920 [Conticribra weissflogii]
MLLANRISNHENRNGVMTSSSASWKRISLTLICVLLSTLLAAAFDLPKKAHRFHSRHRAFETIIISNFHTTRDEKVASLTRTILSAKNTDKRYGDSYDVTGVTLKMAFDSSPVWGVADLSETKSERFTSPESLDMVHRLRRESSAVLVGRGTVERDDCSLSVRRVELLKGQKQPTRVILDPSLKILQGDYSVLKDGFQTLIYHLQSEGQGLDDVITVDFSDSVKLVGVKESVPQTNNQIRHLSPEFVVKDLSSRGFNHIMVEGGPVTARAFLDVGAVDRAILVRAPIKFPIPVPAEMNNETFVNSGLEMIGTTDMGGDVVEYWIRKGLFWPNPELSMWP